MTPDWASLALSIGLCVAVAILEGFLTGSGLKDWYPRLRKPWWQIPLWASVAVGLIVYVIDGFVAYRVLTAIPSVGDRWVTLTALVVVMVLNALWNYAFFEYRSTLVGFLGIVGFLGPLLVLQTALFVTIRLRRGRTWSTRSTCWRTTSRCSTLSGASTPGAETRGPGLTRPLAGPSSRRA